MKKTVSNISNKIVFVGASGHGKVCAEIAELMGYKEIVFLDDDLSKRKCGDFEVVGTTKELDGLIDENTVFFVSIGSSTNRLRIQKYIEKSGGKIATLIHPSSVVSPNSSVGMGSVIMAGAIINPYVGIGRGTIINTCSSVDHDCEIGDWCHVSVGAHICGTAKVGDKTWIGAGAIVINDVSVCDECLIGAGAVVVEDIVASGTYVGVPAKIL